MDLLKILKDVNLNRFIAFDLETTGLDPEKEDIIEFGAVRFVDGEPEAVLDLLIKPSKPIPFHISKLTGITDEMVKDASSFSEKAEEILSFIGSDPLIAHNIQFDISFLKTHLSDKINKDISRNSPIDISNNDLLDTLLLAKIYLPFQSSFSLGKLAQYFELHPEKFHRALNDAETAGIIFLKLFEISLQSDFKDIQKIIELLDTTDEPLKIFFYRLQTLLASGKYHFEAALNKESLYYSVNHFNIIGEENTPEAGKLETEPIDENKISDFFNVDGQLQKSFGTFEHRTAQIQMASQVARAFNESRLLVVEAGTGTGKSMAYLLPAIEWSTKNYGPYGRIIISTNTKNLQEQLFFKDLPIIHGVLKNQFKAVLLKGKGNYLCLDKWFTILSDMKFRLSSYERVKILPLIFWVKQTQTGDIAENNGFSAERNVGIWRKFIAEDNYCPGKSCKYYSHCFLWRARNNAKNAHLVLVNHSLLFSDLAADNSILNEYSNVIFDEAHNIEKVATEYLGLELSKWHFKEIIQKLYFKEKFETGVLMQLRKRVQLSETEAEKKELVFGHVDNLIPLLNTTWVITQGFFKELTTYLRTLAPELTQNGFNSRFRYRKTDGISEQMDSYLSEFRGYLNKIKNGIFDLMEVLKEFPEDSFDYQKQIYQELLSQFTQFDNLRNALDFLVMADDSEWVHWFEISAREDSEDSRLFAAPLNISEILNEKLFSRLKSGIFTSATLTVGKSFNYFMDRIGLTLSSLEQTDTLSLDSPFNYREQVLFAIPSYLPDPRSAGYREALKSFIEQLVREQPRGTLVLFTSYSLLNEIYDSLKLMFDSEKIPLLAQGISGSRHSITTEFKQNSRSFLFGTDSFWEGIDVPGESLENLLITKLPFDVPTEPIIQAKAEQIELNGGNAFMDYTVPEAIIKLRQGFGRLIRSISDFGTILILDTRIIKKMYGKIFLDSLPLQPKIVNSDQEMWELLLNWFQTVGRKI